MIIQKGMIMNNIKFKEFEEQISDLIKSNEYGFEVYFWMGKDSELKMLNLDDGAPKNKKDVNLKSQVRIGITNAVNEAFQGKEYDTIDNFADNQNKLYVVKQDDDFRPFDISKFDTDKEEAVKPEDAGDAKGLLFRFAKSNKTIWGYQKFSPSSIIKKRKNNFIMRLFDNETVLVEERNPILVIYSRVDLLIIDDHIITSNTKMLERDFGLIEYVKERAIEVIKKIDSKAILHNNELLNEYIAKGKTSYIRKMMRLDKSEVLKLSIDDLHKKITKLPRWKDKFVLNPETKKIELNSIKQVESFIDLLDERYTRSDVTQQEYDTSAKKKAK